MGKGCVKATKYFLFLFNLIFFLFGAVIMGFGLWLLLDNQSFIVLLNDSTAVKVACYILIGAGAFSMLMGFLGCLGAVYEIRCLLGLYFTCLLLILLAQIAAGALIYFQKDVLNEEMSKIVSKVLDNYPGNNSSTEQAWDFIQWSMECCGWNAHLDWNGNMVIVNSSQLLFPCSCQNISLAAGNFSDSGFCEAPTPDWPVYDVGCAASVERWLLTNIGVVLGICLAVALIELLGMILSMCLCRNVHREDYTKVPKF
ncbi:CD82 antigen-like [Hippoglossus hippoglossus]|uniref:CD82 antigen-like n=1 Tax=Hippoglossus hippoglossus TaxID=8267 RepID=UPI00148E7BC6|nr:CD82 antigen-like [Hippoglossus hippoglossus]XP_034425570.1 CD82 antigen-like [Hippoglossus hippoglossus]XP_035016465.1 CD82 antigen [Hippoglossus stenolepis]